MRSLALVASFAILAFPACSLFPEPDSGTPTEISREYLTQHWVHSREEEPEASEIEIYRPEDYKEFPASRFRGQYIFYEGGNLEWYYLAPNDAHHFKSGTWQIDSDEGDVIHMQMGDQTVSWRIMELTEELLRMGRIEVIMR